MNTDDPSKQDFFPFNRYATVPGAKDFEYGYRLGDPEHLTERHHRTKGSHSKIKVNWKDQNGDKGDHYWEFNHDSSENEAEEVKLKPESSHLKLEN